MTRLNTKLEIEQILNALSNLSRPCMDQMTFHLNDLYIYISEFRNILFNISITLIFILEQYKGQTYRWQLMKGKIIVQYLLLHSCYILIYIRTIKKSAQSLLL